MRGIKTLKSKLLAMSLASTGVALLAACAVLAVYDYQTFLAGIVGETETYANMVAGNSGTSLASGDAASATQIISSLRAESHIVAARIYDLNGKSLADYFRDQPIELPSLVNCPRNGYWFDGNFLEVAQPVISRTKV